MAKKDESTCEFTKCIMFWVPGTFLFSVLLGLMVHWDRTYSVKILQKKMSK